MIFGSNEPNCSGGVLKLRNFSTGVGEQDPMSDSKLPRTVDPFLDCDDDSLPEFKNFSSVLRTELHSDE